jgi:hypothetical protein
MEARAQAYAELHADTPFMQSIIKGAYLAGGRAMVEILEERLHGDDDDTKG